MVFNLIFWFSVAYLTIAVVWRFLIPAFAKTSRFKSQETEAPAQGAKRFFATGWVLPIVAIALAAGAYAGKANPDLFQHEWTTEERAELDHFTEALDWYKQAQDISSLTAKTGAEWESVNAYLQTALAEAEQVSDPVLKRLHPDMIEHYRNEFMQGLITGSFGLTQYTLGPPKGTDTLRLNGADSLKIGRELLSDWTDWYYPQQEKILADTR